MFWYQDGNVIIKAETTCFKLHRSRLSQYCLFFAELFASDGEADGHYLKIEDCAVYNAPAELKAGDFKNLLIALETPLMFVTSFPTQSLAVSLVRASQTLSCDIVYKFARNHLCAVWDSARPPTAPTYVMTLFPSAPAPAPATVSAWTQTPSTYEEAVYIILFARQYRIPELLKRAFYELIASSEFWHVASADHKKTKLTIGDLSRLRHARHTLQTLWREAARIEPPMKAAEVVLPSYWPGEGCVCPLYNLNGPMRALNWRTVLMETGAVDAGTVDPLRCDLLAQLPRKNRYPWCRWCLKRWQDVLEQKRRDWWAMLDDLMDLKLK
ncbi:hypothetical protein C2E23DRAFT_533947 [Lenzites betulinus]|nr:hypothetical protein C2E23DRAFT_533947 [Lenzites betulinus]